MLGRGGNLGKKYQNKGKIILVYSDRVPGGKKYQENGSIFLGKVPGKIVVGTPA